MVSAEDVLDVLEERTVGADVHDVLLAAAMACMALSDARGDENLARARLERILRDGRDDVLQEALDGVWDQVTVADVAGLGLACYDAMAVFRSLLMWHAGGGR